MALTTNNAAPNVRIFIKALFAIAYSLRRQTSVWLTAKGQ